MAQAQRDQPHFPLSTSPSASSSDHSIDEYEEREERYEEFLEEYYYRQDQAYVFPWELPFYELEKLHPPTTYVIYLDNGERKPYYDPMVRRVHRAIDGFPEYTEFVRIVYRTRPAGSDLEHSGIGPACPGCSGTKHDENRSSQGFNDDDQPEMLLPSSPSPAPTDHSTDEYEKYEELFEEHLKHHYCWRDRSSSFFQE